MKRVPFLLLIILFSSVKLSAQNIGINATGAPPNPSAMLDVSSTNKGLLTPRMTQMQRNTIASPAIGLLIFQTDNAVGYYYYNGVAWTQLGGGGSYWSLNGSNIFNNNSGNVGIGTNTPAYPLTIKTPINTSGWTHIGGADSIIVGEGIGGISASIGTFSNHIFRLYAGGGNSTGKMSIYPTGEFVLGDASAGSFGKFSVQTLNNSYGISHLGEGGNILATRMGGTSAGIGTFSHTNMRILANGYSAIFIAEATGNVGIGTDNPTYKLSVNGNVRSKEVVVETNWADYVFDEKYSLMALKEVELFINKNKHLPNIPSALEIQTKGLHLGETQKMLMEKIEELTLYLIEANKRIEVLEKVVLGKE